MEKSEKPIPIKVTAKLEEFEAEMEWPEIAVYLFNRSGNLVDKQPLVEKKEGKGEAVFSFKGNPEQLLVKIGPNLKEEEHYKLERRMPFKERVLAVPGKENWLNLKIPKPFLECWNTVSYIVKGTVLKNVDGENYPVCHGEVEIYDVDPILECFPKLPEPVIGGVQGALIDGMMDPSHFPLPHLCPKGGCDNPLPPRPSPFSRHMEEANVMGTRKESVGAMKSLQELSSEGHFSQDRLNALSTARERMNTKLRKLGLTERHAFLNSEFVDGVKVSKILYTDTDQFKKLLVDNFISFRYWLCLPWIYWLWRPWCQYETEPLGTAKLIQDGSFNNNILLPACNKDTPDLWFEVTQKIHGEEKVIYAKYPVPCNTYWNHPSGEQVHLVVTDPDAAACFVSPQPNKQGLYVMPLGIGWDGWYEIDYQDTGLYHYHQDQDTGLYSGDPYGTKLDIRMQFHDGLRGIGVMYYRWSYKKEDASDWVQIDTPIAHRYLTIIGGKSFIKSKSLGPDSVGSEGNLFEIPDPTLDWVIINRYDLRFARWDTRNLPNGKYQLRLEMFDKGGNKITDPEKTGFKYILPTSPPPSSGKGPVDDNPNIESDGNIILYIHIDNRDTVAQINSVSLGGGSSPGECQFLEYRNLATDDVVINYLAYHPENDFLLDYTLDVKRGKSGTDVASYGSSTPASPPSGDTLSFKVQEDLLLGSSQCAFAVELHTYPRTRDGYSRIRAYENNDTAAFALAPAPDKKNK